MQIFVCSDLHGQRQTLWQIATHLKRNSYDGVFMLGDLCNQYDPNALIYANEFITLIKNFGLPLFAVHGNQEPESVRLLYQREGVSVHFSKKKLGDHQIIGVGYGDIFPSDPQFAYNKILLTHEPPRAAIIKKMALKHLPNAPFVHLSGHLHAIA